MKVTVRAVPPEDKPIWRNLFPLYQFDLTQFWPCPMNEFGVFDERPDIQTLAQGADWCDAFWENPGWHPLWIRADDIIAGLAVLSGKETGLIPAHVDFEMHDFWILPRFRGQGVGSAAARQILTGYFPCGGDGKIFALEQNIPALRFWRRLLRQMGAQHVKEERDAEGVNFYFRLFVGPNCFPDE